MIEKRYKALRAIGTIYKVLGVIVGVITVLLAVGFCLMFIAGGAALDAMGNQFDLPTTGLGTVGGLFYGLILALIIIIYGGGLALTLFALGESIFLAVAVEENTRTTAILLQDQMRRMATPPPAAPTVQTRPPSAGD